MFKKIMLAVLLLSFLLVGGVTATNSGVSVYVNDRAVSFPDQRPFIDANSRTLVPIRFIAEEMGAVVNWDGTANLVTIENEGVTINLTIGEKRAKVNGAWKSFDTQAILYNARTMVPLRFISETLGAEVQWDGATRTVYIRTDGQPIKTVAPATTELTEQDYTRLKSYQTITKEYMESTGAIIREDEYMSFDEHYNNDPEAALRRYNAIMGIYPDSFKNAEVNFITDPKLIYQRYDEFLVARGVLQLKQVGSEPAILITNTYSAPTTTVNGLIPGQWYEADIDITFDFTAINKDTIGWLAFGVKTHSDFKPVTR